MTSYTCCIVLPYSKKAKQIGHLYLYLYLSPVNIFSQGKLELMPQYRSYTEPLNYIKMNPNMEVWRLSTPQYAGLKAQYSSIFQLFYNERSCRRRFCSVCVSTSREARTRERSFVRTNDDPFPFIGSLGWTPPSRPAILGTPNIQHTYTSHYRRRPCYARKRARYLPRVGKQQHMRGRISVQKWI
jgi:hypothetical protein